MSSPRGCGSCRQPLVSASSLICCHTHAKTLFTAEPERKKEKRRRKKKRGAFCRAKYPGQWCKGEGKTPGRRVNNNNPGEKRQTGDFKLRLRYPLFPLTLSLLHSNRRERRGGGGTVTRERVRMTERRRKRTPPSQNNKMAGSRASTRAPLPFPHIFSERAAEWASEPMGWLAGWRRDEMYKERRGRS